MSIRFGRRIKRKKTRLERARRSSVVDFEAWISWFEFDREEVSASPHLIRRTSRHIFGSGVLQSAMKLA
jgi:hypothetical protein